jgi:hypothetical protein
MKDYVEEKKRKAHDIECGGQEEVGERVRLVEKRLHDLSGRLSNMREGERDDIIRCLNDEVKPISDEVDQLKAEVGLAEKLPSCGNDPVPIDIIDIMVKPQDADDESCISTLSSVSRSHRSHFHFDINLFTHNLKMNAGMMLQSFKQFNKFFDDLKLEEWFLDHLKLVVVEAWVLALMDNLQQVQRLLQKFDDLKMHLMLLGMTTKLQQVQRL